MLTSISAYEGFVEEFLASLAAHHGWSFGQIANLVNMNNPTVKTLDSKLSTLLNWQTFSQTKHGNFQVTTWVPPLPNARNSWIRTASLSWQSAVDAADGWMQVRHCLSHGLVRGVRPETWPGPIRGTIQASSVLRKNKDGKHSLSLHGAESCAHIYRTAAEYLSGLAVEYAGHKKLNWSAVPDFALPEP